MRKDETRALRSEREIVDYVLSLRKSGSVSLCGEFLDFDVCGPKRNFVRAYAHLVSVLSGGVVTNVVGEKEIPYPDARFASGHEWNEHFEGSAGILLQEMEQSGTFSRYDCAKGFSEREDERS